MIIKARFGNNCARCGLYLPAGSIVKWKKGRISHINPVDCAAEIFRTPVNSNEYSCELEYLQEVFNYQITEKEITYDQDYDIRY